MDDKTIPEVELKYLARHSLRLGPRGVEYVSTAWELLCLSAGEGRIRRDGRFDRLEPHTVCLTSPGMRVHVVSTTPARLTLDVVSLYSLGYPPQTPIRRYAGDDVVVTLLEHALWLDSERVPGWESAVKRSIGHALWVFMTGYGGRRHSGEYEFSAPIIRTAGLLREKWESGPHVAPSLPELARAAGVTPVHLSRLFDRELGMPPATAIRLVRIRDAASLLRTDLTVREVARHAGFTSVQHFSHVFRAVTGMSPSGFRADPAAYFELPVRVRRYTAHLFRLRHPTRAARPSPHLL